ncbi:MAG: hypothetical protein Ct9H300mP6_17530 [Gammaproteobacteria bacterium]|nr:MAG: hypothetical protein Ct9H300mP6_17530 [Gammaproteobacteria bacterium]
MGASRNEKLAYVCKERNFKSNLSKIFFLIICTLFFPVSIGEYQYPQSFDDPVVFLMNHVPTRPYEGLTNREQHRKGRYDILKLSYQDYEDKKIFKQLKGMFGSDFRKEDVAGIKS